MILRAAIPRGRKRRAEPSSAAQSRPWYSGSLRISIVIAIMKWNVSFVPNLKVLVLEIVD